MRLRWKKQQALTGLMRIGAGPRGSFYHDGEKEYASISALGGDWMRNFNGWYWVTNSQSGMPHKNTCDNPCKTEAEAKKQAAAFVKAELKKLEESEDKS